MGIAGSIASLIGLPLAFYFYFESIQQPCLTYYLHPARATVVSAEQSKGLTINYNGKQLDKDVSAVQIAIWNAGKCPVRHEDLLSPIAIQSASKCPILEAKIRKTSREEILFTIDSAMCEQGKITFNWKALECNDGASVQLIYAGSPTENFIVTGSVIGQHRIIERKYGGESLKTIQEQFEKRAGQHIFEWVYLILTLITSALIGVLLIWQWRSGAPFTKTDYLLLLILLMQLVPSIKMFLNVSNDSPPPFGF